MAVRHYFTFLRVMHVITAYFALVATLQNYISSETMKKAHILESADVSYLASRIQCMFTILSCFVRISVALTKNNKPLYYLAMSTYGIVLVYLYMEINVFRTATLGPNMPSIVIGAIMLPLLTIGLFLWDDKVNQESATVKNAKKTE